MPVGIIPQLTLGGGQAFTSAFDHPTPLTHPPAPHSPAATLVTSGHLSPASYSLHVVTKVALVLGYCCNLQETSRTGLDNSPLWLSSTCWLWLQWC